MDITAVWRQSTTVTVMADSDDDGDDTPVTVPIVVKIQKPILFSWLSLLLFPSAQKRWMKIIMVKKKHCINITSTKKKFSSINKKRKNPQKAISFIQRMKVYEFFFCNFTYEDFIDVEKQHRKREKKSQKMKLCTSEIHFMFVWLFFSFFPFFSRFYQTRIAKHSNLCNFFFLFLIRTLTAVASICIFNHNVWSAHCTVCMNCKVIQWKRKQQQQTT